MPPKPKFTREEITAAALELVSEGGMEALTSRDLGARLGSSARPIFTVFQNMEDLRQAVRQAAMERFNAFSENLPTDFLESYKELFDSLMQYDFNFQLASKQMFIHKNTLSFRLGKIKERLNINPMQNFKQKEFASNFCLYLKMILS